MNRMNVETVNENSEAGDSSYNSTRAPDLDQEGIPQDADDGLEQEPVGRRLTFENIPEAPGTGRPSAVVFFESGPEVERGPLRRDSQLWNEMIEEATRQAERLRTPSRTVNQTQPEFRAQNRVQADTVIIDGRPIPLVNTARNVNILGGRMYDKTKRSTLSPESLQSFLKSATGYVLPKGNKLSSPVLADAEGHLKAVNNLGIQLRLLKRHLTEHDMIDVFTIVIPAGDVTVNPQVSEVVSLFDAYPRLHANIVANSNTWYHLWSNASYLAENMNFSFDMLRKNTEDDLWLKCQEDYEDYAPAQRGGPLMLFLILRRIQDVSETAIDHVKQSLSSLRIRDIPGEDVDKVVSLIKSAHSLFKSASSSYHSFIPEDFPKMILTLLQTSSVPEFNQAFLREQQIAQHQADKTGQLVNWPTVSELTSMATNSYKRLKSSNQWLTTPTGRRRALTAAPPSNGPRRFTPKCWNCGEEGHTLKDCKKPKDNAKIETARQAFNRRKRDSRSSGGNTNSHSRRTDSRPRRMIDGKPHILNKKGVFVLDQKTVRTQHDQNTTPIPPSTTTNSDSASDTSPSASRTVSFANTVRTTSADPVDNPTSTSALTSVLRRYTSRSGSN